MRNVDDLTFLKMCKVMTECELRKTTDIERRRKLKKELKTLKNDIKQINDKERL